MALFQTTYNIVLNAPSIVIQDKQLAQFTFQGSVTLATAQVAQVYDGCTLATLGQIVGYEKSSGDVRYNYNNTVYNMINDNQIRFWFRTVYAEITPPS